MNCFPTSLAGGYISLVLNCPISDLVELSARSLDICLWQQLSFVAAPEEANTRVHLAHQSLAQEIEAMLCDWSQKY
jgi:hypothetical protein